MNPFGNRARVCTPRGLVFCVLLPAFYVGFGLRTSCGAEVASAPVGLVLSVEGKLEVRAPGTNAWQSAKAGDQLGASYQLRTGPRSRALVRLSNQSVLRVGELMEYELQPPKASVGKPTLNWKSGPGYFFSREKPQEMELSTPVVTGAIRGTEFDVLVAADGQTRLAVLDGVVELANAQGTVVLTNGEQAVVAAAQAPAKTAVLNASNIIQWNLYYPAVLDPAELGLSQDERQAVQTALAAYVQGDLPGALAAYPAGRQPASPAEHVFLGQLLLAVGLVEQCENELAATAGGNENTQRLAGALRELIAAVKLQPWQRVREPELASEWLADSYYLQAGAHLPEALTDARRAVEKSAGFGYGWERVAELEFSFGRTGRALEALNRSLELAPRNAQAVALKGFLLSAQNRTGEALQEFDRAIALDGALANAWLGRGLCRIRHGQLEAGQQDLTTAAALEPNRAVLRSYLGKAYNEIYDFARAEHELELARRLDPADPTSLLYQSLLHQQENRINEAVRDLEESQALNENRSVYRSRMLLDQDQAVRGANLATIYRDAGMDDVSVREATRAVNYDYANFSAHYFLANSFNELRDPEQVNLRYETPWLSEYLLANLLAPVGARTLSQTVSQQEYSKLFERDALGVVSRTEYLSRGNWLESGAQYGNVGNFGYAVDANYRSENGWRPNNDQQQLTLSLQLKYDLNVRDSFYFQSVYYDASGGDLAQYYDQHSANPAFRFKETQEPLLLAGFRHQWTPELYTLVLAGRFDDDYNALNPTNPVLLLAKDAGGQVIAVPTPALPTANLNYDSRALIYSAEVQQIWQHENHSLVLGGRYQTGTFETLSALGSSTPTLLASLTRTSVLSFATAPINQNIEPDFERWTGYGYYNWHVIAPLLLSAGITYDALRLPINYRSAPVNPGENNEDQISPKAGFILTPWRDAAFRFAYTRSLGGVSFDQSVRLEPTQVAGFNQAFRSLIPEAVAGSTPGAKFETFGVLLEQKFPTGTYLAGQAELLNSDANLTLGAVDLLFPPAFVPSSTRQHLDYTEKNLIITANQLIGDWWSIGARYRLSDVTLTASYPDIPPSVTSAARSENGATLHQLSLFALFNHSSGVFARAEGLWNLQYNHDYQPALPGDNFWQVNLFAGYRFLQRRIEAQVGVLNLTDRDYHLNPLNLYAELPRQRTFFASLQLSF